MPSKEVQALVRKVRHAWLTRNADEFVNLFAANGDFITPSIRCVGPTEIRHAFTDYAAAFDEVQIDIHSVIQEGDRIVIEWDWHDREKATGKRTQAEDAISIELEGEKIRRWREYIDVVKSKDSDVS